MTNSARVLISSTRLLILLLASTSVVATAGVGPVGLVAGAQLTNTDIVSPYPDNAGPVAGITPGGWEWLGPGNIGGRVRSIAIDPNNSAVWFAGSVGGGIWKTTNSGASWQPVDDFLPNLAITSIVIRPDAPSVMYAGTGEDFFQNHQIRGAGIFKSVDGGTTWSQLASTNNDKFAYVNRLAIAPGGSLLAATSTGLFRSSDGSSFSKVYLPGVYSEDRVPDVVFNPVDPTKAFAAARRVWYSNDSGITWIPSNGLPDPNTMGHSRIAYARSNPSIVYAATDFDGGMVYRSNDGGANFVRMNAPSFYLNGHGDALWVDPTNPDFVIIGGEDLWQSPDGGWTWTKISSHLSAPQSPYADQHVIVEAPDFDGKTNTRVVFGNSGGVYSTDNVYTVGSDGASGTPPYSFGWSNSNNGLGVTQFYSAAGSVINGVIIGGTQDHHTVRYQPADGMMFSPLFRRAGWHGSWFWNDGGFTAVDPIDPNYLYDENAYLELYRSPDGGSTSSEIDSGITDDFGFRPIASPFILDPNNPSTMLAGGVSLWRSTNIKAPTPTWHAIKPSMNNGIMAIAVASGNSDRCWVGYGYGSLAISTNCTAPSPVWTDIQLPTWQHITDITVDPTDFDRVYVALSGDAASPSLIVTADNGATWTPLAGNGVNVLPNVSVLDLAVHPNNPNWLYAATVAGIFASEDRGVSWQAPQRGPANVSVEQLLWMGDSLVAATNGRGLFRIRPTAGVRTLTLSADRTAPQPPGTTITFTADAAGGSAPYAFKFMVLDGPNWTVVQDWSPSNHLSWTPASENPNYRVRVWVRSAGSTVDAAEHAQSMAFSIVHPRVTGLTLTADTIAPQMPGTAITFTASAVGGTAPYAFKFTVFDGISWRETQDWSTSNNFRWTPQAENQNYRIRVWVRSSSSTLDAAEQSQSISFPIAWPRVSGLTLVSDKVAPQAPGTPIIFTANATGGSAPYSYKFRVVAGSTSYEVRDWSILNTFAWTPQTENQNYRVEVSARSAWNTIDAPEQTQSMLFPIVTPRVTTLTMTSNFSSPQPVGATITFTAIAGGGAAPYGYKFFASDGVGSTFIQEWRTTRTFAWTPAQPGSNYSITVWARSAGNTADAPEMTKATAFTIKRTATVTGVMAQNKVYDGTTNATLNTTNMALSGVVGGDDVRLSGGAACQFFDRHVGNDKPLVVTGLTLTGADAGNYFLIVPLAVANITPINLTATVTADNKFYDGYTSATVHATLGPGVLTGDSIQVGIDYAAFNDASVGTGKPVTAYLRLWGMYSYDYTVNRIATASANILPLTTAVFISPLNNALDIDMSRGFTWSTVPDADCYYLYVGTTVGAKDIVNTGEIHTTFYWAASVPARTTLYARLWTKFGGVWRFVDITFTAAWGFTYPYTAHTYSDLRQPFQWTSRPNAEAYYLYVGSAPGLKDLVNSGEIHTTSYLATNLPLYQTLYARIWVKLAGVWSSVDRTVVASATVTPIAEFTRPTNAATNVDLSQPITWTAVANAQAYYLYVGSSSGASDLLNSGELAGTSYVAASLPTGQPLHARLWTKVAGVWRSTDITFTASSNVVLTAKVTAPANGAVDVDSAGTIWWTPVTTVQKYYLYVGSTPGAKDLINSGEICNGCSVSPLTTSWSMLNGGGSPGLGGITTVQTVYVRMWTMIGGIWRYSDSSFTTAAK